MTPRIEDQEARDRIRTALDETLFVTAGAGSGKTKSLVDRVLALIDAGLPMHAIAAITFTEKAAGELRQRIRSELETRRTTAADDGDSTGEQRYRDALEQLDTAAISTLHAFAQRILTEHAVEAQLPPNVEVLDEVASEVEFEERWRRFRDRLLDDPALEHCLLTAFASRIKLEDLRAVAATFQDNWDLIADGSRLPWSRDNLPVIGAQPLIERIEALLDRRAECTDPADKLCAHLSDEIEPYLRGLQSAPDEYEVLRLLKEERPSFAYGHGIKHNWHNKQGVAGELKAIGEAKRELAAQIACVAVQRLVLEIADFTRAAAAERRANGRLEFHDLLVGARDLLRGPNGPSARERLRTRYQRLLLDEFQDTDPIQIDLAVLIASDDPDAGSKPWWDIAVDPGRLFFVGDPKQSIYRFRRADIALFLRAAEAFGPPVSLTTNFRTTPPLIDWVNAVFGRLIAFKEDSQPAYDDLHPAPTRTSPEAGPAIALLGAKPHADDPKADDLREREADDVARAVLEARTWRVSDRGADHEDVWRGANLGDITILLPARTSLPALEKALEDHGIAYRAETSSLVYATSEIRDLLVTVRALADPTDELALVAAVRSPAFGCGDDDLFTYKYEHGGTWDLTRPVPDEIPEDHPVADAMRYLRGLHAQLPWLAPSEVLDRLAADRRLFELGYADGRPRDLWRRLRFVIDQARAWSEAENGTLREYLDWVRLQASEISRVSETVLPESDEDSVRILTIHGAKGLEFPITILSGMSSQPGGRRNRVEVAFPPGQPVALKIGKDAVTPEYLTHEPLDEQMDFHERLRLLYVAATRAKDHLVVSLHRTAKRDSGERELGKCTNAELLARAGAEAGLAEPLDLTATSSPEALTPAVEPLALSLDDWESARTQVLADSGRPRSLGASDVTLRDAVTLDDDTRDGIQKQARDLELPPWQKGRYGSAIGRAVHAVLQTIDLATGAGLDQAAAAQAAAEGVTGREADVARLARAALGSPTVQAAVTRERWRETYVATSVAGRTLEGYIDLLYRDDGGLVVVDYKTASSSADLDIRLAGYRAQGGAYAVAVEQATGEPVLRVVFVFLTAAGPVDRELPDLPAAKQAVIEALAPA